MAKDWVIIAMLFAAGCSRTGDVESVSEHVDRCARMRDRLVAHRLDAIGPLPRLDSETLGDHATRVAKLRAQHQETLQLALGTEFIAQCTQTMKLEQLDCVIASKDSEGAMACSSN